MRQEALRESASFRVQFLQFMSESDKFELVGEMNLILSCGVMKFGHTHHPMANDEEGTLRIWTNWAAGRGKISCRGVSNRIIFLFAVDRVKGERGIRRAPAQVTFRDEGIWGRMNPLQGRVGPRLKGAHRYPLREVLRDEGKQHNHAYCMGIE